jgi:2-methylisocitrate lyase-like PEP mutase family enzyme
MLRGGYSNEPSTVGENLKAILASGIAGINIEDGTDEPALLAKKIEAIKRIASSMNVDVFVNARTDVYLQNLVADQKKVEETLARAAIYRAAGADGLFVPALADLAQIAKITAGTELRVNLLAWAGLSKVSELGKLGARRISAGVRGVRRFPTAKKLLTVRCSDCKRRLTNIRTKRRSITRSTKHDGGGGIHVLALIHFGGAEEHAIFEFRIEAAERQAADDLLLG